MKAILSSSIIFETGTFEVKRLCLAQAKTWVEENNPVCYSTHDTVKVLGVEPSKTRLACNSYDEALCLKPLNRLDFKKQYSIQEILEVGVKIFLIKKTGG